MHKGMRVDLEYLDTLVIPGRGRQLDPNIIRVESSGGPNYYFVTRLPSDNPHNLPYLLKELKIN